MRVRRMKTPPVALCFGEMLWDCLPQGRFAGGAPLNVGYHLARLGWRVAPVSAVGADPLGMELIEKLGGWGIETFGVAVWPEAPTGTVEVVLDEAGKPCYDIRADVAWDSVWANDRVIEEAQRADALIFGSLAQRSPSNRRALSALLRAATKALKVFDVNLRPPFDDLALVRALAEDADLVKLNDEELARLTDGATGLEAAEEGARALSRELGVDSICVTCGALGAGLLRGGRWWPEPGRPAEVADTVGAGDAFLAALVAGLRGGDAEPQALAIACRLGEWVAARPGATPPYRARRGPTGYWVFEDTPAKG